MSYSSHTSSLGNVNIRNQNYFPGKGLSHEVSEEALPPTIYSLRLAASMFFSIVTAKYIVGNLDELREKEQN